MNEFLVHCLNFQAAAAVEHKLREAAEFGRVMSEYMEAKANGLIEVTDEEFEEIINNQRKLR